MGKIAIITNTFPPEFGAAPSRLYAMAQGLFRAGHKVTVLTGFPYYPLSKTNQHYKGKLWMTEKLGDLTVRRHWVWASHSENKWQRAWSMLSLALSMLKSIPFLLKYRPDWIIVQYPPIALPILSVWLAKRVGARLIVNFSDLWPLAMADLGVVKTESLTYRLLEKIEKYVCKNAFACLSQSNEVYDYLEEKYQPRQLLYRTGVMIDDFATVLPQGKEMPLKIAYMGVLGMAQGVLEVCKQIDFASLGVSLHIYGDGLARKDIAQFIESHPHRGIFLHEAVPLGQIPKTLGLYNASLIPQKTRIRGTVPSKIYEAMAAGLPIIFHGGGEGVQLIEEAGCGWVSQAQDYEQLRKHIIDFAKRTNEERYEIGQKGRQAAVRYYDRAVIINSLIEQMAAWE